MSNPNGTSAVLHLLGTGASVSDPHRTTTMLALSNRSGIVAVDCGGDLIQRMLVCGLDVGRIEALFLTHAHSDHVTGFPLVIQRLWLNGRDRPIPVFGPAPALDVARRLWEVFELGDADGVPDIHWHVLPSGIPDRCTPDGLPTLDVAGWLVQYVPVTHGPETVALRFADSESGAVITYSSETAPEPRVAALAQESKILVHEANGKGSGHSSVSDAAQIAATANADRLVLVHLPKTDKEYEQELASASEIFSAIELGIEGGRYPV